MLNAAVNKFLKDQLWAYALVIGIVLLLPNGYNFYFVKFSLPYFFAGYLYHKYASTLPGLRSILTYFSFLLFPLLLLLWNRDIYIYNSGQTFSVLSSESGLLVIYRFVIGMVGVLFFVAFAKGLISIFGEKVISEIGKQSLGIFLISTIFNNVLLMRLQLSPDSTLLYSLVITPALALIVTAISYLLTVLLSKFSLTNQYLLGGR
ncbi:acyltransferase family protein [Hymenobacter sp.]|uniref:acyltransferase family protein n=1 Tax=Hymenobacter sp. TaxID=1898978 RepID=UPI002EDA5A1F